MIDLDQQFQQLTLIDALATVTSSLPRRDNVWAGMMIKAFNYYGKLTARQEEVVRGILARAGVMVD